MTNPTRPAGPAPWWRTRLARLFLLVTAVAAPAAVVWLRPRGEPAPEPADVAHVLLPEPVALAPGVYLLGRCAPAAVYLVDTDAGLVLIDSGLEPDASVVTAQIAELGFDVNRLRAILLTHVHADHSLGAEHLRRLTGARVYAGRGDCPPLAAGGPREAFFSVYHMPELAAHATTVDVKLAGGETLAFGTTRIEAIATPGHTTGSVCYLLERPGLRALFTGDVIQHLANPRAGDLGTYTAYLPPLYRGDVRAYLASLRRLRALPVPDLVLPGHPQMDPVPQDPHLGAARWRALLDRAIAEMGRLEARYAADGANFLDGVPRELRPGLHYLGTFGGSAVYALATPKRLAVVDAPGGPGLVGFLAGQFRRLGWEARQPDAVLLTSADAAATAGLPALVAAAGCRVVAPKAGLEEVRRRCPPETRLVPAEDLDRLGWFDVRVIPLGGRGLAPVAYRLRWEGKAVLISGRIPVKLTDVTADEVTGAVRARGGSASQYLQALNRLAAFDPDLWLPARPVHGQNANLYDADWKTVLAQNRRLLEALRSRHRMTSAP